MKIQTIAFVLLLSLVCSCGSKNEANPSKALYGATWQLEYMSGPRIAFEGLFPDKKPQITFNKETGEVSGNSSCNGYSAKYTLDGNALAFGEPGPTTMMFCGEGEKQFLNMMQKINAYHIDTDGKLNLMMDDVSMMRYKKISE